MHLSSLHIRNHPILKDIDIDLINEKTGKPYSIVAFVGENGCGKTTLLNEIFNYSHSPYIIDKDDKQIYLSTFLRQGQLYYSSMDHIKKLINGDEPSYPSQSKELLNSPKTTNTMYVSNGVEDVSLFGDKKIEEVFAKDEATFIPGGKVAKLIDGKSSNYDYDAFSSGQQELIFKLQTIKDIRTGTDFLLMDEPETSLHPRWQKIIIDYLISRINVDDEFKPQIFIATHSEKILEALLKKEDTQIIRMFKDGDNNVQKETISQMDLVLPRPTFAELDYVIFKIDSFEYCSELYDLLEWRVNKKERAIDKLIRSSRFYDEKVHYREWFNELYNDVSSYNIATYCRNYFHHPKNREVPTYEQLHGAIELLRNVILNLE